MLKTQAGDIIGNAGPAAYSISLFCETHGISRSGFYNLMKTGQGPRIMHVGKRRLISQEAAAEWRRKTEAA